jgi:hypothetical protein
MSLRFVVKWKECTNHILAIRTPAAFEMGLAQLANNGKICSLSTYLTLVIFVFQRLLFLVARMSMLQVISKSSSSNRRAKDVVAISQLFMSDDSSKTSGAVTYAPHVPHV